MARPQWTDQQVFDQMYSGAEWPGPAITYSFPQYASQIRVEHGEAAHFTPLNPQQQAMARLALATWNDLIPQDMVPGPIAQADIQFGNSYSPGPLTYAHAYYPPGGSVWLNALQPDLLAPVVGARSFVTYIHEIGHALGLDHMGDYNGPDMHGPSSYQDSSVLSVMSYYGPDTSRGDGDVMWGDWLIGPNGRPYAPQTPMLNDVMVIQAIYGEAVTRADDTVYGFGSTVLGDTAMLYDFTLNTHPIITLYDSGGIDTLNLSGWDTASLVDLRPAHHSSFNGMTNNLAIAHDVIIENAVTGAGNDRLYGNSANNFLDGGAGYDRVYFTGELSNYQLSFDLASRQYTVHDKTGADGTDTLVNIEYAGFQGRGDELNNLTPAVHRFHNTETGGHFYTANNDEASHIVRLDNYQYEGVAFLRDVDVGMAVIRFYNAHTGSHFYSADAEEIAQVMAGGAMTYEGMAFRAYATKADDNVAVHRFYNTDTGAHFYTADEAEMEHVIEVAGSFNYEGIAFYANAV